MCPDIMLVLDNADTCMDQTMLACKRDRAQPLDPRYLSRSKGISDITTGRQPYTANLLQGMNTVSSELEK